MGGAARIPEMFRSPLRRLSWRALWRLAHQLFVIYESLAHATVVAFEFTPTWR